MASSDIERWQRKYARFETGDTVPDFIADDLLVEHAALFAGEGHALDLACGLGANALWLGEKGYDTLGVDGSSTAIAALNTEARRRHIKVTGTVADLDHWVWPNSVFNAIVVFRFLQRDLFDTINKALAPGGLLVYQTFNENHLKKASTFNPDYVLKTNELNDAFAELEVIVNDQTGTSTRFIGRKPG